MELASNISQTEIFIEANIKMEDLMVLGVMNGKLKELYMRATLKMVWGMERENGKRDRLNIMEDIARVWNKGMVSYTSLAEISIRVISFKIKKKDMDKCFGLTVVFTKGNGKMGLKMVKDRYTYQAEILSVVYLKIVYWCKQCHQYMKNKCRFLT